MTQENNRNTKLGIFVLAGTVLLISALYFVGRKQNIFGSTFELSARFYNVNGLMKGNNVRFAGIDVGTVSGVTIINDSTVKVDMVVDEKIRPFIKKSALASVGTDGLMGNKLININTFNDGSGAVSEGDELRTVKPLEMDEMVRTLNITNDNIRAISGNLRHITDRISSKNNLWNLLLDTVVAENVKSAVVNIRGMTAQGLNVTGDLQSVTKQVRAGKGSLGQLLNDSTMAVEMSLAVKKIKNLGDSANTIASDLSQLMRETRGGKGSLGRIISDTSLAVNLNKSILDLDFAANSFDENMEAMRHSWPFKKYFRKKNSR